jgi:HSP20 family protein
MNLTPTAVSLRPALHTREDESGVHLSVALPGVRKEDLKLTVQEGVLTLEAPRANASTAYRLSTRLSRRLAADRIEARLENGVLEALIPLSEDAQPRSIQVN